MGKDSREVVPTSVQPEEKLETGEGVGGASLAHMGFYAHLTRIALSATHFWTHYSCHCVLWLAQSRRLLGSSDMFVATESSSSSSSPKP